VARSELTQTTEYLERAIAEIGKDTRMRSTLLEALRVAEQDADDPIHFKDNVRWPIIQALLKECGTHKVRLENDVVFEVSADSRIERALLLSSMEFPDHVWEPQTTKLLMALALDAENVIVGGAYIGDQVVPMACHLMRQGSKTQIHAFEPMMHSFERLRRNIELNSLMNVNAVRQSVWNISGERLVLTGDLALASSAPATNDDYADTAISISVDDFAKANSIKRIGLIMLDTEGGELKALQGAAGFLSLPVGEAPSVIFEIHNFFVDWSNGLQNTEPVRLLIDKGYAVYAIRDFHSNHSMREYPIEIIPAKRVYLEGPPHGFNMLAVKDESLIERLGMKILCDVSPKLILEKDPLLHHPQFKPEDVEVGLKPR
jgi:FkbM family methyltransferase